MTLFFHSDDVDHLLSLREAVAIVERALCDLGDGRAVNAPRKRLHLHQAGEHPFDTVLNIYAGGSSGYGAIGAQVALHRKAISGSVQLAMARAPEQTEIALIYGDDSGALLGVMAHRPRHVEGIGDLRTAATSLAGMSHLAGANATRVGVYGAGHQAYSALLGLTQIRPIESVKVFSPTREHREAFAGQLSEAAGVPVKPVTEPREAAQDVDIILCMTNSNVPVIDGSWLSEGQYIVSVVGSNIELVKSGNIGAPRREIDDETLRRCARVVALSWEQAEDAQQGDLYWPVQAGTLSREKIVDIADVLAGRSPGRTDEREIILYKNQGGQGVIDIALAHRCYELALKTGVGHQMDIRPRAAHSGTGWRPVPWFES